MLVQWVEKFVSTVEWYPTRIIWPDISSIFLLSWFDTCLCVMDQNTFKWLKLGLTSDQHSVGMIPSSLFVGNLFNMYVTVDITSPHNSFGRCLTFNIIPTIFIMVQFFLSLIPFCWGVYGGITSCTIPSFVHSVSKYFETSPPSVLRTLILWPLCLYLISTSCITFLLD